MKLHLPKLLLIAVLAAVNTVGFQAHAEWAWRDPYGGYQTGAQYYYDKDADKDNDGGGTSYVVTEDGYILKTNAAASTAEELRLCPNGAGQERTIAQIELTASNKIFDVAENPWAGNSGHNYKSLTIDCLDIANGEGVVAFGVTNSRDTVNLKTVNGTLSSVNNVGTLTLGVAANEEAGTAASTTNLAGTITNSGTLNLNGVIVIADLSGFDTIVEGSLNNTTHGFRTGTEKAVIAGGTGTINLSGVTLKVGGKETTLADGALTQTPITINTGNTSTSTLYEITSGYTTAVEYNGTSGDTAGATGFRLENGTTVKLTGASNAGLTDRITIDAGDGGKATVMFANGKTQRYAELGLGSLINVESGAYVLGISGSGTVVTTTVSGGTGFHRGEVLVADGGKLVLKQTDGLGYNSGYTTPKITIKDGTLALGARQTLAYTTLDMQGGAIISALTAAEGALADGNAPMLHAHDNFTWEVSNTGNVIESGVAIRVEKEATININSGGELTFKGTFTDKSTAKLKKTGEGSLIFEGAKTAYGLIDVQEGSLVLANGLTTASGGGLTIDEDASLTVGSTIFHNGSGAVALNGTVTVDTSTLNTFEIASTGGDVSYSDDTDGFMTTAGATYYLVKGNAEGSTLTTSNGYTLTYGDDGVTFEDTTTNTTEEYYVNTANAQSVDGSFKYKLNSAEAVLNVNGTLSNSRIIMGEGKVAVSGTNILVIATASGNVHDLLTTTTGDGTIKLSVDATLNSPTTGSDATVGTGTLIIDNAKLTFGTSDLNSNADKTLVGADISSFNAVELNNGHLYVNNPGGTIKNLTVTDKNGTLEIFDMGQPDQNKLLTFTETTTLDGNLTVKSLYNAQLAFTKLSGTKNLIFDDNERDPLSVTISGAKDYTGKIHVKQTHNNLALNVAENAGVHVHFEGTSGKHLQLENIAAGNSVTLQGVVGHLGNGTTIAADIEILNSSDGQKAGLELNDGYHAVNTFTGDISGNGNLVINKDSLHNHGLTFTGDVSEWTGRMDVAKGTHTVTYTGDATEVKNVDILVRGGSTADIVFDHTKAATVTAPIKNENSTLNLVVKNTAAEGTTFNGSVQATTATIKAGTVAKFTNADVQMTNLLVETGAQLSFTAKDALNVSNLEVANVGTLTVANGETAGSIKASGAVTLAGGATINAAVVDLNDASSVSFDVASGAIALNGALTMSSTEAFVTALGGSLAGLTAGEILTVFTGVSSFTVGDVTYDASNALTNVDLRDWGADAAVGQYTLTYDTSANVGSIVITVGEVIPEPASATLSLAALMMLCARRRRRA